MNVLAKKSDYRDCLEIALRRRDINNVGWEYVRFEWAKVEDGAVLYPECTLQIPSAYGQEFLDALWREGYRPSDIGTAGHLAATQEHLKDMRRLAFSKLGVEEP